MKIPYSKPGTMFKNKTGGWRDQRPNIDIAKCIKCGQCNLHCPDGCIEIMEKGAVVDFDFCKGCGVCAKICPVKCIKMEREEK